MVYNALIRYDENMNFIPDLAERWEVAEDGKTWTFHLRQGVRFHDGTKFNAEAVRLNFERVLDPAQNHKRLPLFQALDHVEEVDEHTVRIVTRFPFGAFEPTMAHVSAAIVNPTLASQQGKAFGKSAETTSGTGPETDHPESTLTLINEEGEVGHQVPR